MHTGERQAGALRKKYLEAVLKQDVGFFDTDARTGDIVFSVSTDTLLVQDAISERVLSLLYLSSLNRIKLYNLALKQSLHKRRSFFLSYWLLVDIKCGHKLTSSL